MTATEMTEISLKFTIFCCLVAGSSLVRCDYDKKALIPSESACFSSSIKPRGCCYRGKFIAEGEILQITACKSCTCERGKPICYVMDCAKPPEGYHYVQTATECCKLVCNGCNYNGIVIPEGETKTVAPCQFGTCSSGKVMIAIADCGPLQSGCRYESTMEECCKLICDGCYYNGIHIPEGEFKTVAPCEYAYCYEGEVAIAVADCARPKPNCHYESTLEECCKLVCDGSVVDEPIDGVVEVDA